MLATPELIQESSQFHALEHLEPLWRTTPLYRSWLHLYPAPAIDPQSFSKLPLLGKSELRARPDFIGSRDQLDALLRQGRIELEHTSGTSNDRLPVVFARGWWNLQEERALRLNSFVAGILDEPGEPRRATLTPPACNGLTCPTPWISREQRTVGSTLFVNLARIPFLLGESEQARMAAEIQQWMPRFLDVDPVHGAWFALYCERHGIRLPSLRFIVCSYEFVSTVHRSILERVFQVPVFNLYGSTETGHLLMENERGDMKQSAETAFLEVLEPDAGDIGSLVVTTLSNEYMPLLRYEIGDLVRKEIQPLATVYTVHGRIRDLVSAPDGRRLTTWQVDQCFAGLRGFAHYEFRQNSRADYCLRYIPENQPPTAETLQQLSSRLHTLLGADSAIRLESMSTLVPAPSGKFRLTRTAEIPSPALAAV
ncbi:MAG: hypothetical protein U1F98_02130 [Verrucomicrobiota bacterium]